MTIPPDNMQSWTTVEDVLAVLGPGERISYNTLTKLLRAAGAPTRGVGLTIRREPFVVRWRDGEIDRGQHYGDESADVGPLFVERAG